MRHVGTLSFSCNVTSLRDVHRQTKLADDFILPTRTFTTIYTKESQTISPHLIKKIWKNLFKNGRKSIQKTPFFTALMLPSQHRMTLFIMTMIAQPLTKKNRRKHCCSVIRLAINDIFLQGMATKCACWMQPTEQQNMIFRYTFSVSEQMFVFKWWGHLSYSTRTLNASQKR